MTTSRTNAYTYIVRLPYVCAKFSILPAMPRFRTLGMFAMVSLSLLRLLRYRYGWAPECEVMRYHTCRFSFHA